jgi:hypothetical protein
VHQTSGHQRREPHLQIILLTVLALAAACAIKLAACQASVEAASALEPVLSHPGGYYDRDIRLEIAAPDLGAGKRSDVIFTVDGSVPTYTVGTVYTQPIHLRSAASAVTVVRARVVMPDGTLGPVVSASYFIGVRATLPMLSLIMDPDDIWGTERGIYARPVKRGNSWERPVHITYVDKDRRSGFQIPAGIRIHGGYSRYFGKKSLRLYFRQEYGASRLEYPLFAGSEVRTFKRLILHAGGQDWSMPDVWNWTLMRNQLVDELALELDGYAGHDQPTLLFINGRPWGIYHIRERIDGHFLADHYGIESADLLDSPENVIQSNVSIGDREHWDHLMQFLETHDLADPANYAYVESQVAIAHFIDYNMLKIYGANEDWPNHNVQQFRPHVQGGRWQWMFWDSDHGFGALPIGHVGTNTIGRLLEEDHPDTGGRDVLLFRKLLGNPVFLNRFLSRTADLLNTVLVPQSVLDRIDALAAELAPDIEYETVRWAGSTNWGASVEEVRDFARYRPDFVRQHVVESFGLDGTAALAFNPPASGSGYAAVNGLLVENAPWQGVYFQGVPVQITAVPVPGYRFAGWDPPDLPQTPVITLTLVTSLTLTPRFEAVDDDALRPGDVAFADYHIDEDSRVEGAWFELQVTRLGGVDLRGWRVTDNDTKTATDEGSLIFADTPAFACVPRDTTIRIVVGLTGDGQPPQDDLNAWDRRMTLYAGNPGLNTSVDPGFNLGPNDNLALLAPGPTEAFDDDYGIAFVANSTAVTPASFGVLVDGVIPTP